MKKEYKLQPAQYKEILNKVNLINIRMIASKCKLDVVKLKGYQIQEPIKIDIKTNPKFEIENASDTVNVFFKSTVKAINKVSIFEIQVEFLLEFTGADVFNDDFFDIFKDNSLFIIATPYIREFVNSTTARFGIPPLVLPLIK